MLTYPNYNYFGYPYESFANVIYEGGIEHGGTPEPGTLVMMGSGSSESLASFAAR